MDLYEERIRQSRICFGKSGQFRLLSIVVGVPIWETGYLGFDRPS